jgi:hypothetical protein
MKDPVGTSIDSRDARLCSTLTRYRIPGIENIPPWNVDRFAGAHGSVRR